VVSRPGDCLPPYQRLVDGLVLPVAVGGHSALDFCNTLAGWGSSQPREYLTSYAHLAAWVRAAGLIDAATGSQLSGNAGMDPAGASRVLERAHELRRTLHTACTEPDAEAAWQLVGAEARAAAAAATLVRQAPPGSRWVIPDDAGLARPVLELGRVAGDLLASTDLEQVGCCPGADCGWLFLDPRGRRRWCMMATCGNRAKARRHADRARSVSGSPRKQR
jgi:predicted RNA-binding Zn ribbon-like protein